MSGLGAFNMTLAFVIEVASLIALGRFGYVFGNGGTRGWALAAVAMLVTSVLWYWFAAPKAPSRLEMPALLVFKVAVFAAAFAALRATETLPWAIGFAFAASLHLGIALLRGDL